MLTKRVKRLNESMTLAVTTLARELKDSGKDILSFSAGEPDFDTPEVIKEEAIRDNALVYKPSNIITSNGAKHSLFNLIQVLIEQGDEVIIPAPYWVTYPELVRYSGGIPVPVETNDESGFKITPKQLKDAITTRTKKAVIYLYVQMKCMKNLYMRKNLFLSQV